MNWFNFIYWFKRVKEAPLDGLFLKIVDLYVSEHIYLALLWLHAVVKSDPADVRHELHYRPDEIHSDSQLPAQFNWILIGLLGVKNPTETNRQNIKKIKINTKTLLTPTMVQFVLTAINSQSCMFKFTLKLNIFEGILFTLDTFGPL